MLAGFFFFVDTLPAGEGVACSTALLLPGEIGGTDPPLGVPCYCQVRIPGEMVWKGALDECWAPYMVCSASLVWRGALLQPSNRSLGYPPDFCWHRWGHRFFCGVCLE